MATKALSKVHVVEIADAVVYDVIKLQSRHDGDIVVVDINVLRDIVIRNALAKRT